MMKNLLRMHRPLRSVALGVVLVAFAVPAVQAAGPSVQAAPGAPLAPTSTTPVVQLAAFPVQGSCWFTNTWGSARSGGRRHEGVDIMSKTGQLVYAANDGVLSKQAVERPGGLSGNAWWLTTSDGSYYFYAHMSSFAPDLKVGSAVVAGQIIGAVGKTGSAAAPHLHFEIHPKGGSAIDPTPSVLAVDGCKVTTPLPQPGDAPATPAPATPAPATPAPEPATPAPSGVSSGAVGGTWRFVSPVTAYDSSSSGRLAGKRTVRVDTLASVKSAPAVLVRLTARDAGSAGFLTVHPCDVTAAGTASLTFPAGSTVVGTSAVEVVSGAICVTTGTAVHVKVEILAGRSISGVGLQAVVANRVLDTRNSARLVPGTSATVSAASMGFVPGTQAISATVTMVTPSAAGTLSIGLCGAGTWSVPISSDSLSSFSLVMRVSGTGWCVKSSVSTDLIIDVTGVWAGSAGPGPVDPVRVFDSRTSSGPVGASPVQVQIAGQGGVPAGATAAMVAITIVSGGSPGIVFAVPCGQAQGSGVVAANAPHRITTVVVPVQLASGAVCLSAIDPTDVIVDVVASGGELASAPAAPAAPSPSSAPSHPAPTPVPTPAGPTNSPPPAPAATGPGVWQFVSPATVFDSAKSSGRVAGQRTIAVDSLAAAKSSTGVLVRLTARDAAGVGHLLVHPCDTPGGGSAGLTFPAGATVVGTSPVEVASGTICLTTSVAVHVKVEVLAVRSSSGVGLRPMSAARALDTRTTTRLVPGATATAPAAALGFTPGAQALSATITVVDPDAAGTLTIGLCGAGSWSVPISSAALSSFAIVMRVSSTGWCVRSSVATEVIIDVTGVWVGGSGPAPVDPVRAFDSRTSTGQIGPTGVTVQIAGLAGVPADATSAMVAVTTVAGAGSAIVFAVPCGAPRPAGVVTASNGIATVVVPVQLVNGALCVSAIEPVDVIIDVLAAG